MRAHSNGQDSAAVSALSENDARLARIIGSNRLARESTTAKMTRSLTAGSVGSQPSLSLETRTAQSQPSMQSFIAEDTSLQTGTAQSQPALQSFIAEELQEMKAAMASEVQASKNECLAQIKDLKMLMESGLDSLRGSIIQRPRAGNIEVECLKEQVLETAKAEGMSIEKDKSEKTLISQTTASINEGNVDTMKMWRDLKPRSTIKQQKSLYKAAVERHLNQKTLWHLVFDPLGINFPKEAPSNCLARFAESGHFHTCQSLLIVVNTIMMGYEADVLIRDALAGLPQDNTIAWLSAFETTVNIMFTAELAFRMFALRSWFFVSPDEWRWNMFDILIVGTTLVTDFIQADISLNYLRTLRMLRALRAIRAIRMLKVFRQLREMFFAILACLVSLVWFFLFMAMIMFMVSIFLLQGLIFAIHDMDLNSAEAQLHLELIKESFGSLPGSMFSLLGAISGGNDWVFYIDALKEAGSWYIGAFVAYVLFVTVGVINVLTGVFLANASVFTDESLIIANQKVAVDDTVSQFLTLFKELDTEKTGAITGPMFEQALNDLNLQAYFEFQGLDPFNGHLIFELLDTENDGSVDIGEFVLGMMKLKGGAKALDARVIRKQVGMLPEVLSSQ